MTRAATICAAALLLAGGADAKPWRHGVIEPKSDAGFILMATTRDFAAKHGLELEIVPLKNENLGLRGMLSGELDSYEGSPPIAALAHGADVKELGCYWEEVPHLVFAKIAFPDMAALKGHTMASSAPGSMPDLVGRAAAGQAGLAGGAIKLANVGGDADRYRALLGGVVDAAVISSEYTPLIDATQVHAIAKGADALPNMLRLCYQTSAKTLAARPDDTVAFLATEIEALRYAMAHKDETVALSQKLAGQKPKDPRAAFMFDQVVSQHLIDPSLPLPIERFKAMAVTLQKMGVTQEVVDTSTIAATEPRLKALQLVGP